MSYVIAVPAYGNEPARRLPVTGGEELPAERRLELAEYLAALMGGRVETDTVSR